MNDRTLDIIAKLSACIESDRAEMRALDPFTQRAARDAVMDRIGRNIDKLEDVCSAHAKAESTKAGYRCAPVQGVKIGGGWAE